MSKNSNLRNHWETFCSNNNKIHGFREFLFYIMGYLEKSLALSRSGCFIYFLYLFVCTVKIKTFLWLVSKRESVFVGNVQTCDTSVKDWETEYNWKFSFQKHCRVCCQYKMMGLSDHKRNISPNIFLFY